MTNLYEKFNARRAATLAGFKTVAMLDYLQRSGVFVHKRRRGERRGKGREYTFRDIIVLKAIKRLLDSGATVANLKKSLVEFQITPWISDHATLEDRGEAIRFLIVSHEKIYIKKDVEKLIELSSGGQLAFSFIIDLDILHTELRSSLGLPSLQEELFKQAL